jgi:hypothetical protein
MNRQRGVTLVELMLASGIGVFITSMVVSVLYFQQTAMLDQLDYGESQQNGRAAMAVIRRMVRRAGWGYIHHKDSNGAVALGACYQTGSNTERQQVACDALDNDGAATPAMDRLRVSYMRETGFVDYTDSTVSGININIATSGGPTPSGHPFSVNDLAAISGVCSDGSYANDLLKIVAVDTNIGGFQFRYQYVNIETATAVLTCTYNTGFRFGKASLVDFYVDRTDSSHPKLRMRVIESSPYAALTSGLVIAEDIDDLQVQYYLDNDTPVDSYYDTPYCNDITSSCHVSISDDRERLARLLGVEVAIVVRTRDYRVRRDFTDATITVHNHTFVGKGDGYRRWIYRAMAAARNAGM